jgi:hypothetical protein
MAGIPDEQYAADAEAKSKGVLLSIGRYEQMASLIFSRFSSWVSPCEWHPCSSGEDA